MARGARFTPPSAVSGRFAEEAPGREGRAVVVPSSRQYDVALRRMMPRAAADAARGRATHPEDLSMNEKYHLISSVT